MKSVRNKNNTRYIMPEINYNIIYCTSNYGLDLHLFYCNTILSRYIIKYINNSLHKWEMQGTVELRKPQITAVLMFNSVITFNVKNMVSDFTWIIYGFDCRV